MTAALMHMFDATPVSWSTAFEMELDEVDVPDGGFFQLQFEATPLDGSTAFGVDWGDGKTEDWPKTSYKMAHSWTKTGTYRVVFDRRLRWFRLTAGYGVEAGGSGAHSTKPLMRMLRWGEFVESAKGTFCGWTGTREGRGLVGEVPKWGRSLKDAICCYQGCLNITGGFPEWPERMADCTAAFDTCRGLGGPLPDWPPLMARCDQCYQETGATGLVPPWPEGVRSASRCYRGCRDLTGARVTSPELLMPDSIEEDEFVTGHDDVVTDAGEGLRALFKESWGGTLEG